jgi:hypothetical protein
LSRKECRDNENCLQYVAQRAKRRPLGSELGSSGAQPHPPAPLFCVEPFFAPKKTGWVTVAHSSANQSRESAVGLESSASDNLLTRA